MGQRTAILLKKNFGNNRSTITLIHHQWGIGKTMPAYLMQEILKSSYPLDRRLENIRGDIRPIDVFFTFEPLNNPQNNYITNKEVATDDVNEDIWNRNVRIRYGNQTDNNNGLMLVEVTQLFDDNGNPKEYGKVLEVKVGFALGYEEIYYNHKKLNNHIKVEAEFDRLVSMEEYAIRTFRDDKYTKEFVKACRTVMELIDVKEVYSKAEAKAIKGEREHINNCIEALTKDLPEGQTMDVPMDLREPEPVYYP